MAEKNTIIKEPNGNSRTESYKKWNKMFTGWAYSRVEKAGNRVSELVHRPIEVILYEGQRGKILKKNEEHLRVL